ncbi:MADS-box protein JOINTLESS-like [Hibiscus syriacus]|uniref:MADS-box protein JOINTLESS-like n=1 Tax=Hibiscus syriacus TaxID=106335 RepID=UPI001922B18A|nr:MADS-box protein JOINTLESS-like [Hibiscus syriacus]
MIHELSVVMSFDFSKRVSDIHYSLIYPAKGQSKNISNDTLAKLTGVVNSLHQEKQKRLIHCWCFTWMCIPVGARFIWISVPLVEDSNQSMLTMEIAERSHQLRQMRGEDLQGLNVEELQQLEKILEVGLSRVIEKKGQRIMREISDIQRKEVELMEENERLKQQVLQISEGRKQVAGDLENIFEEGHSSESVTNVCTSNGNRHDYESSNTFLKLGSFTVVVLAECLKGFGPWNAVLEPFSGCY